jgi:hypothetical protein
MTNRREQLRELADELTERDDLSDAYVAKSFTDRLFVVEVPSDCSIPEAVMDRLAEHNVYPASEVYEDGYRPQAPFAGADDHDQYRFVDVRSRGELQSYVVD